MELANGNWPSSKSMISRQRPERSYRDLSGRPLAARGDTSANCAKSALTWRASTTSCRTSQSSSAMAPAWHRRKLVAFSLPSGIARLTENEDA
jgi:hypothetical protein